MARAIQLAQRGLHSTDPNPRVGCVMVKNDRVIAEGWHQIAGGPHAEVHAIDQATDDLTGASCYVTLEPCCHQGKTAACTETLKTTGIKKVIAAMTDPNPLVAGKGLQDLQQSGIETALGLLNEQAQDLNPGFVKRMQQGLPYIRCKVAMSTDAKTSLHNGVSQWITSEQSRGDVQSWRARSSTIVTGVNTVLADDPSMNVRLNDWHGVQPVRVIVDSNLQTPLNAKIFNQPGDTIVVTVSKVQDKIKQFIANEIEVLTLAEDQGRVDLLQLMQWLAQERQINEVLIEAGPTLSGAMISAGLVDELIVYQSPLLMGSSANSVLKLLEYISMDECIELQLRDHRFIGTDERTLYSIKY